LHGIASPCLGYDASKASGEGEMAGDGQRDWHAIEDSPEFGELTAARRKVVAPLLAVFVLYYGTFLVLVAYAHGLMGSTVYRGITVGYVYAVTLIPMTWAIAWIYIKASNDRLEPLAERARAEERP
jgi:uncharacterized membrane protein (DUF485 family)